MDRISVKPRNYVKILGFNSGKGNLKTGYCIGNQLNIQKTVRCIADQAAKLEGRSTIRVKFLKDDMTQSGDFSIIKIDGNKYGKIDFIGRIII